MALWTRIGFITRMVADVVEPRRVAVVLTAAEDTPIDFGFIGRLTFIDLAGMFTQITGCFERLRAVGAGERAVDSATAVHFQQFIALEETGANCAAGRVAVTGQMEQVAGALAFLDLLFPVPVHVRFQRHSAYFLGAYGTGRFGRILVHHPDVVAQDVAGFILALADGALEVLLRAVTVLV